MTSALVIDDNREAADSVVQMLGFLGLDAQAAYGPRAAMISLKDASPDIVFMDINMPGVDGFEVVAYLRRYPNMVNVPVIFITSDDQPETKARAKDMGAVTLIVKPASLEALESALKTVGLLK